MRMIALKLEFGVSHNQIFERTLAVHFTDPFHVSKRVADKCNDGTLLLQGVDPSIRAEVWPFLLGVMDGSSSQSSAHMVSVLGAEEANNLHKF
ncbi:trafficking protein particle complex II-specific subunit 130 homolog isoform X2 [Malus sylvestris]|uniref:trafficking protein particle complex II-specific subunit 130 homolog isoform X2 n=1 Tax=Malus sylvestris TaxID=3752 RepID=UPI0021AC9B42|nr:trafficking protein particle complex II-specific subunit 130 homolog isoform X2 [Malus sylvestris]